MLCIIPARGGSKGIPKKNLKPFCGKPLISWAIECAQQVSQIENIWVSTDDPEIQSLAKKHDVLCPILRPSELAQDKSPMLPVLLHALQEYQKEHHSPLEGVILLNPTAPLRNKEIVENSIHKFLSLRPELLVSAHHSHRNPYFNMIEQKEDGFFGLVKNSKHEVHRRQDAPQTYDLNTLVWIFSVSTILEQKRIPNQTLLFETPSELSIDLDTPFDFWIAEQIKNRGTYEF